MVARTPMRARDGASSEQDQRGVRHAFALAQEGASRGARPFGAVLRGPGFIEAVTDDTLTSGDPTAHAEMLAIRRAASSGHALHAATLYASVEPCPMCAGAILYAGVGRLVFGVSRGAFDEIVRRVRLRPPKLYQSCRVILEDGGITEVIGPLLEPEGLEALMSHPFAFRRGQH